MSAETQELQSSAEAGLIPRPADASALLAAEEAEREALATAHTEERLGRLPMQLDIIIGVKAFRVQDLLALQRGSVVETRHEHSQDVPVRCGGALLLWGEFELVEQRLAVRVTRLA